MLYLGQTCESNSGIEPRSASQKSDARSISDDPDSRIHRSPGVECTYTKTRIQTNGQTLELAFCLFDIIDKRHMFRLLFYRAMSTAPVTVASGLFVVNFNILSEFWASQIRIRSRGTCVQCVGSRCLGIIDMSSFQLHRITNICSLACMHWHSFGSTTLE